MTEKPPWHRLVEENLDLAPKCVSLYCRGPGYSRCRDDLEAEARLTLCKVAMTTKFKKRCRFRNYAVACIRNRLMDVRKGMKYRARGANGETLIRAVLNRNAEFRYTKAQMRNRRFRERWWEVEQELSEGELGVAELLAWGRTHAEAALILGTAPHTVSNTVVGVRRRFGLYQPTGDGR